MVERTDKILESSSVEHLDKPAINSINLSLYGVLCSLGIQYKLGKSLDFSGVGIPNDVMNDVLFARISSLLNVEGL